MKAKFVPHLPGSETMASVRYGPVTAPGCWCQGKDEVRPGLQPRAQGPCLDKWDKWPSRAAEGPGLVSNESCCLRQKTSQSLPAICLGASTDSSARLFFQRHHCTMSKLAMSLSSQIHQRKDVSMAIPNILRDSNPILLAWVLRCRDKLLAFSWDPRNGMLIKGLSASSLSGKTLSWNWWFLSSL